MKRGIYSNSTVGSVVVITWINLDLNELDSGIGFFNPVLSLYPNTKVCSTALPIVDKH